MKLQKTHQEMDRISILPQDIIGKFLSLMPMRDALRTSILSKKWRYCWTSMPRLEFRVITSTRELKEFNKHKLVKDIFHVLLLHKGPILELSMCIDDEEIADEIFPVIIHLSRNINIKKFEFKKQSNLFYNLPSSFFSLQRLEHIVLEGCGIELPLNFNRFSMLRSLRFHWCIFTSKMLQRFFANCPVLEKLTLEACHGWHYLEENKSTFVELFKCLPSIQHLSFYDLYLQDIAKIGMPQKLRTPLVHLRTIGFNVCLQHNDLFFVLNVINNSPNLEKIILEMRSDHGICVEEEVNNMLDFEDYSGINLDKLEQLEIRKFQNFPREIGFVKLIMVKSPVLKKAQMQLYPTVSVDEEVKMLRDLVQLPFPRASPTAKFIIKR